ncbi:MULTISPECIES: PmoA family protein [unclassified Actinotalea]|uniref:DUF6807 domain-containing protein n=1 Tax=unclassified Actinotalea TaxID=2638618 RepID=UPI0015F52D11|nr:MULTISPECIES: PmoA family protein [unclassified Actinotalea]
MTAVVHAGVTPPPSAVGPDAPVKAPPWDPAPRWSRHHGLLAVQLGPTEVLRYVDGAGSPAFDAPRPHLHPLRTRSGVVVSDAAPRDHTWHVGLSVGVQDVDGTNLWGGRTYLPDAGYTWRHDHGRVVHRAWERREPGAVREALAWLRPDGTPLLHEERTLRWDAVDDATWRLELGVTLRVPAGTAGRSPVVLGSPGTHGRERAGYGGVFLRVAPCRDVEVSTPLGSGEEAVHGTRPADGAHWLAWRADVGGRPVTIAVAPGDEITAQDPWFVRVTSYPGIGSALAWDTPLQVAEGSPVRRTFTWVFADGRLPDDVVAAALAPEYRKDQS